VRVRGGDPQIGRQHDLEATAESRSVDRADDGFEQPGVFPVSISGQALRAP
jgi:hypothetical protein